MSNARLFARLALASSVALAMLAHSARAEDIDIYSLPSTEGLRPNVLFIIDNTANWGATIRTEPCNVREAGVDPAREEGTKMGAEKCALYKVISSMSVADLGQYNLAFMLFNESPDAASYPRQAFINVTSEAQKTQLLNFIAQLNINNDKGNNPATAEAFYEAWLYFTSNTVRFGNKTATKHDTNAFTDGSKTRYAGSPAIAENPVVGTIHHAVPVKIDSTVDNRLRCTESDKVAAAIGGTGQRTERECSLIGIAGEAQGHGSGREHSGCGSIANVQLHIGERVEAGVGHLCADGEDAGTLVRLGGDIAVTHEIGGGKVAYIEGRNDRHLEG